MFSVNVFQEKWQAHNLCQTQSALAESFNDLTFDQLWRNKFIPSGTDQPRKLINQTQNVIIMNHLSIRLTEILFNQLRRQAHLERPGGRSKHPTVGGKRGNKVQPVLIKKPDRTTGVAALVSCQPAEAPAR